MPDRRGYRQPQVGAQGFARTMKALGGPVSLVATDLAVNKTVGLFVVPKGFVLTSLSVTATDMDTNGTAALVFSIGDAGDPDRFVDSANTAQAGGTTTTLAAAGAGYEFTEDTEIVWVTEVAAATAAAGTVSATFFGYVK